MVSVAFLSACLIVVFPGGTPASPHDLSTYEALKAKTGKDPQAQVKLALWCEAHGLNSERLKHLAQAVISDPKNVTARGLLGLIAFGGRWESVDKVSERVKADVGRSAKLAEYTVRRANLAKKEDDARQAEDRFKASGRPQDAYASRLKARRELAQTHASLGMWCKENGLGPESIAHYTMAVHLDPSRDVAWRNLGYVKRDGRWTSPDQAAADEREEQEQRLGSRRWDALLRKWKNWSSDPQASPAHRAEAAERIAAVSVPRAVPAILKVFPIRGSDADQTRLIQLLGQIDHPASSRALAEIAVTTHSTALRERAIDILRTRPRRDYAGRLVEMIRGKIKHEIIPIAGPGSTGTLVLSTPRIRMILAYDTPAVFQPTETFRGYVGYDANGLPVIAQGREIDRMMYDSNPFRVGLKMHEIEMRTAVLIAEANLKADVARQRMAADLSQAELTNEEAAENNSHIIPVLQTAAGAPADLGDDEEAWNVWWYDTLGYSYQSPPQVTLMQNASPSQLPGPRISTCFVAGTQVRTLDGPRPIEAIQVGDQVLSQDAADGGLGFQPVVYVHHNPPGKTLRVSLISGESLQCSVYHRFWKARSGWVMARELVTGDTLRTLDGLVRVAAVEPGATQPLFNLDVAGPRTFFVGPNDLLVHDNTLPDHRLVPFDILPHVDAQANHPK